ncbi:dTDP-3-amino-3,4, 6-trideoxy-alpha-D-glucopyranose [Thalassocella blandensis]|nr:dTDP-3-amino-3,4, 6-trideoxy-alpha-D-glucopyranose [Thalassocella blandensis]
MTNQLYTDLTQIYDLMCADIDYQEQCNTAHRLFKLLGNGGNAYLDLACGTGPHVEHFLGLGFLAHGLDLNGAMLDRACMRCPKASFFEMDMSSFRFREQYDLVTCFLYSMHYCYPEENFRNALQNAFNALKPGGVLCFDTVDKSTIANDEGIKHHCIFEGANFEFQSRWAYPGQGDELSLFIDICRTYEGEQQFWHDQHRMLAVSVPEVQALLESIGFSVTVFERDFSRLIPWGSESGNVFIAAVKAS